MPGVSTRCNLPLEYLGKVATLLVGFSQRVVATAAVGQSVGQLRDEWSTTLGSSVGLRTINQGINQVQAAVAQSHQQILSRYHP